MLSLDVERFAARREDPNLGRSLKQCIGQARASAHQVLAIVENQEQRVFSHVSAERLRKRFAGLFVYPQDLCGRVRNQRRIPDRREVDEPDAIWILLQHVGPDLQRQAGLAEASHTQQRQQVRPFEQALGIGKLALPTDERGNLLRQVVGCRFERA